MESAIASTLIRSSSCMGRQAASALLIVVARHPAWSVSFSMTVLPGDLKREPQCTDEIGGCTKVLEFASLASWLRWYSCFPEDRVSLEGTKRD